MNSSVRPLADSSIYVAGHRGMVGSALVRRLKAMGCADIITRGHAELDLTDQQAVRDFFAGRKIDYVVLAAARVGGIHANNTYPAEFIYLNLMIEANVIHEACRAGVKNLLFLGSSCIYPKFAPQPMKEEYLLTGTLEPTNEPYAVAKIAGIKMCNAYNRQYGTDYRSVMPTNLYGPEDNFHLQNSHVLPALIRKFHLARLAMDNDLDGLRRDEQVFGAIPADVKEAIGLAPDSSSLLHHDPKVIIWGTGKARREFLHVDDMAAACVFVMGLDQPVYMETADPARAGFLNIGTGEDSTIGEVAELVRGIVGFPGETVYNSSQPDGTPRKLLDVSRLNGLGWRPAIPLEQGLSAVYSWYAAAVKKGA